MLQAQARMRCIAAVVVLLLPGCIEKHFAPAPLPPLLATSAAAPPVAIGAQLIIPGEHMIWAVSADGLPIGRAEMLVRDKDIVSSFNTDGVASMVANVHEQLETPLSGGVHPFNIHTAIAWIRAWSPRDAVAAKLDVVYDGDRYLVTCEPPLPDSVEGAKAVKVACQFAATEPVTLTLELTDSSDRVPLRVLARIGSMHVQAELLTRELRGEPTTPVPPAHASMP